MLKQRQVGLQALNISQEEIYLAMGYRGAIPDSYTCELIAETYAEIAPLCLPRYMFRILEARQVSRQKIEVGDTGFAAGEGTGFTTGGIIGSYLQGMTQVCLFVATAGKEYDAYLHTLKTQDNIVKEYIADSIGSVIAEACGTLLAKELETESELFHTLPYSPGYCGWNICEQQKLFSFFPPEPCGIVLSDSFLMSPVKSISGFIGLGKELRPQPYRCEICNNKQCYKRKEKRI
ncbi:MAG: methionine synthase [Bacteroides oleiciplenus]|nr:methionine synthase [Bacteroides oleiciplenus]